MCIRPLRQLHLQNHLHLPERYGPGEYLGKSLGKTFELTLTWIAFKLAFTNTGLSGDDASGGLHVHVRMADASGVSGDGQRARLQAPCLPAAVHI